MRTSYTVRYERDEMGWWVAQVKAAPAAITQGRTIALVRRRKARRHARALVHAQDGREAISPWVYAGAAARVSSNACRC